MDFFTELGGKISKGKQAVSEGAKNMADISKRNAQITDCEREIAILYQSIGEKYYQSHKQDAEPEMRPLVQQVSDNLDTIRRLDEEIQMIRNLGKCPYCGREVARDAIFCSYCGKTIKDQGVGAGSDARNDVVERVCPNCGTALEDEDVFCVKCGTRFEAKMNGRMAYMPQPEQQVSSFPKEETVSEKTEITEKSEESVMIPNDETQVQSAEEERTFIPLDDEAPAFCWNCGAHLEPGDGFCPSCGSRIEQ